MLRPELAHLQGIDRRRIQMPSGVRMRLNRLERPEPWPAELQAEIASRLATDAVQQYPDYPRFYDRLAAFVGVQASELVVGAGIEEFIRMIMAGSFGRKVAVLWPTCAMFDVYAAAFQVDLKRIVCDPRMHPSADMIMAAVGPDTGCLLLANPGQPVETLLSVGDLIAIARHCAKVGCMLAIDEAYHGFGAPTAAGIVGAHDNVVVLRTFSKAFGAAGIRLGYAIGGPRMIKAFDAVRQSGEVSAFSMATATALMDRWADIVQPGIEDVGAGRDWLRKRLRADGFDAWGTWANHVLVDLGEDAQRKASVLAAEGILVRVVPAPMQGCLLITCGSVDLMRAFYERFSAA